MSSILFCWRRREKKLDQNTRDQLTQSALIDGLEKKLEKFKIDWERERRVQGQVVQEFEGKLSGLRATRVVVPAQRSINPVGTGPVVKVAAGFLLGLVLAVFAMIVAGFAKKAHEVVAARLQDYIGSEPPPGKRVDIIAQRAHQ